MANIIGEFQIVFEDESKELLKSFVKAVDYMMEKDASDNIKIDAGNINWKLDEIAKRDG